MAVCVIKFTFCIAIRMTSILYYISLPVYWIFGILYPVYQSYKSVEAGDVSSVVPGKEMIRFPPGESGQEATGMALKSASRVSHWVNFWIVSNLFHLLTGILEHGSPETMPAFYIILKMAALIYLPLTETDLSGKILECCVTPFFKPLVPEIDSAFQDVVKEVQAQSSKVFDLAKSKAATKRGGFPRKPSPMPSSS